MKNITKAEAQQWAEEYIEEAIRYGGYLITGDNEYFYPDSVGEIYDHENDVRGICIFGKIQEGDGEMIAGEMACNLYRRHEPDEYGSYVECDEMQFEKENNLSRR